MKRGLFVAIEGVPMSGKSSVVKSLQELYNCTAIEGPRGSQIYSLATSNLYSPKVRSGLTACALRSVYEKDVEPPLLEGSLVISDTWIHEYLSTLPHTYYTINTHIYKHLEDLPSPDLTIILSTSVDEAKSRFISEAKSRFISDDYPYELHNLEALNRYFEEYATGIRVDATKPLNDLVKDVSYVIEQFKDE